MEVVYQENEGLNRAFTVTLTAAELDEKVTQKLEEAAPNVSLKGFRKGKVPMAHLRKMFGRSVLGEALQESVDGAVNAEIEKSGDKPAVQPEVKMTNEDWEEGQDVVVSVSYEALPIIPETDFSGLTIEAVTVEVDDSAVDESLAQLAENSTNYTKRRKGSKAKADDQVIIDFVGSVDGVEFEGGKGEDYPLVLGSGSFIPGFEDQLIDQVEGNEVEVKVTFPENYGAENLAGKDAVFQTTIKAVNKPEAAPIDDELAKRFGAEDLEAFKTQIRSRLAEEYQGAARAVLKRRMMDGLDGLVSFDIPKSLLDAEAKQIAHQLYHEDNPHDHGHDHGEIEPTDEHIKLAERRVRLGLLLADVGQKESVTISEAEMREAIMRQAQQYGPQAAQFLQMLQQNPQMQEQIRAPLFEDKVVDLIRAKANVTEKSISKDDLEKLIEDLDQL